MTEIGTRTRNQPAPPHAIFEALTDPHRAAGRPWLVLLDDEVRPDVLRAEPPSLVIWSSIWARRPDARIRFDLLPDGSGQGTDLCWTLLVEEPSPSDDLVGHMRKRMNQLINAELRYSFGN